MKTNKVYIGCAIAIAILLVATCATYIYINLSKNNNNNNDKTIYKDNNLNVVASLEDEVSLNSIWCGTFNIVWNELKENLVKGDVILDEPSTLADNLNKSTFKVNYLSEDSYYKKYGNQTFKLKEEIEKAIKDKFNEDSDILDDFEWEEETDTLFFYTMLKKNFEFNNPFDVLDNSYFNDYKDVKYFGIDDESDNKLKDQVEVLYYQDYDNFAVKIKSKGVDEVILVKTPNGKSFLDIYNNILDTSKNYSGSKVLKKDETLSVPNIDFKTKVSFKEIENKSFRTSENVSYRIAKTVQTINFTLDNTGGKLKSEAGLSVEKNSFATEEIRRFTFNKTFAIFLKEKDKDLPYFAGLISDISQVQENVKAN